MQHIVRDRRVGRRGEVHSHACPKSTFHHRWPSKFDLMDERTRDDGKDSVRIPGPGITEGGDGG